MIELYIDPCSQLGPVFSGKNVVSTCSSSTNITIHTYAPPPYPHKLSATMFLIGADVEEGRSGHEDRKDEENASDEDHGNVLSKEVGDGIMDHDNVDVGKEGDGELRHRRVDVEENQLEGVLEIDDGCADGSTVLVSMEDGESDSSRKKFDEEGDWKTHDAQSKNY